MSWWEFYKLMCSIFDEDAAGARTWQNHFGGDDETQENEPTGENTTAETPESEDDDAAVGETGTDEVEETKSGSGADNEPAPGAGEDQRMIPPTELQTAERIIESLQTGPRNRQEKRALESKFRRRKNPHKSLKNQSLRASKRKKMKPKA